MRRNYFYASISDSKSINNLIKTLEQYRDGLQGKMELLISRLLDIGVDTAESNTGDYAGFIVFKKHLMADKNGIDGVIVATDGSKMIRKWMKNGKVVSAIVSPLLMAEFGSGWLAKVMSTKDYRGNELGVGQGTFPGQTHAFDKDGWSWTTPDGKEHHSYGEAPTFPMYSATIAILNEIDRIAKEVFGNG